jgi:alpha-ribazole phosphatase
MTDRVVHLLRHSPPVRPGLLLGHTDAPALTPDCPRALAQARKLPLRAIVSSDLRRAADQAACLACHLDLPLTLSADWRELDFGDWDGKAPNEMDRSALARFWDDPEANAPPGGERWSRLCQRVRRALAALEPESLVVTHAGAMRAAVAALTGLDHRGVWAFDLPYGGLLSLRIWPDHSGQVTGLSGGYP